MLVGQTFSGKTRVINALSLGISSLSGTQNFVRVHKTTINPKSILQQQLYGSFNPDTHEWAEGVLAKVIR